MLFWTIFRRIFFLFEGVGMHHFTWSIFFQNSPGMWSELNDWLLCSSLDLVGAEYRVAESHPGDVAVLTLARAHLVSDGTEALAIQTELLRQKKMTDLRFAEFIDSLFFKSSLDISLEMKPMETVLFFLNYNSHCPPVAYSLFEDYKSWEIILFKIFK